MAVVKVLLSIIYVVLGIAISVVILDSAGRQVQRDWEAPSAVLANSYWSKNKGRSMEGALEHFTRYGAIVFMIITLILEYSSEGSGIIETDSQNTLRVTSRRVFFLL